MTSKEISSSNNKLAMPDKGVTPCIQFAGEMPNRPAAIKLPLGVRMVVESVGRPILGPSMLPQNQ